MKFRSRFALPLVVLLLTTWVSIFTLPHDHEATGAHSNCLTCRLADSAAGTSPVLDAVPAIAIAVETAAPAPREERIVDRSVTPLPPLRAPPIA